MALKPTQQNLFATPLLVEDLQDEGIRSALEEAILRHRREHPGVKRSNVGGGWHSDLQLMRWGGPPAQALLQRVLALVASGTTDVKNGDGATFAWQVDAWANVNERGGANARHVHGGCYWSAVYYVRVDEGTGSDLILYDPRMPTLAMHAPTLRFRNAGGERDLRIKPRPGLLVIFPSWLGHEVDPSQGDGLRISIAINLMARGQRGAQASLKGPGTAATAAPAIEAQAKDAT